MKIILRHKGNKYRHIELPELYCVHNDSSNDVQGNSCTSTIPQPNKTFVANISFGKRYFDYDPIKGCKSNPPIATSSSPSKLREFYRFYCCSNC